MRRKKYPINVLSRAKNIAVAWDQFGTPVSFGSLTQGIITADITQAERIESQIRNAELQLAALRNERDALYLSLWDKVKRVYDCVKGMYGDDSTQYEMVGRKRASQRKRRVRRDNASHLS
jgi:hypothetical protein